MLRGCVPRRRSGRVDRAGSPGGTPHLCGSPNPNGERGRAKGICLARPDGSPPRSCGFTSARDFDPPRRGRLTGAGSPPRPAQRATPRGSVILVADARGRVQRTPYTGVSRLESQHGPCLVAGRTEDRLRVTIHEELVRGAPPSPSPDGRTAAGASVGPAMRPCTVLAVMATGAAAGWPTVARGRRRRATVPRQTAAHRRLIARGGPSGPA